MKEISERFPKFWADYHNWWEEYVEGVHESSFYAQELTFKTHFGYLVLEYFPKHGIEIERRAKASGIGYNIWERDDKFYPTCIAVGTAQESIAKAAEIRERQLEGK